MIHALLLACTTAAAPADTLPWKGSLAEAAAEAKRRNIPILLYRGKDGNPT